MKEKISQILAAHLPEGQLVIPERTMQLRSWGRPYEAKVKPNHWKVASFFCSIVDELRFLGDAEPAKNLLCAALAYVQAEAYRYYRGEAGYSWQEYRSIFDAPSPCCICDLQYWFSAAALRNGFEDTARYAVSIQCPPSPPAYRVQGATAGCGPSEEGWRMIREGNAKIIEAWDGPTFAFMWERQSQVSQY